MILLGESALGKASAEFMAQYHSERNHHGLDNALICPEPEHAAREGEVHRRESIAGNYFGRNHGACNVVTLRSKLATISIRQGQLKNNHNLHTQKN
jgi:hypothetical protein